MDINELIKKTLERESIFYDILDASYTDGTKLAKLSLMFATFFDALKDIKDK